MGTGVWASLSTHHRPASSMGLGGQQGRDASCTPTGCWREGRVEQVESEGSRLSTVPLRKPSRGDLGQLPRRPGRRGERDGAWPAPSVTGSLQSD